MRFRKLYLVCAVCVSGLCGTTYADLITVDFNDLAVGTHLTDQYASQGAVFSGHDFTGNRPIAVGGFGGDPGTLVLDSYCNGEGYIQVDFSIPVDYVSVDFMPFESSGLTGLDLDLFDAGGTLLEHTFVSAGQQDQWYTVAAQTASATVAYARFYCGDNAPGSVNAVYNDNLSFGTASVPEPSSITLVVFSVLGLLGMGVSSRKKK